LPENASFNTRLAERSRGTATPEQGHLFPSPRQSIPNNTNTTQLIDINMSNGAGIQELMAAETRASQIVAEARIGECPYLENWI